MKLYSIVPKIIEKMENEALCIAELGATDAMQNLKGRAIAVLASGTNLSAADKEKLHNLIDGMIYWLNQHTQKNSA